MSNVIKPTVGRQVHFYDGNEPLSPEQAQPHAATVCFVHNDREVNLAAYSHTGT